jgi:hypothetical protein
MQGSGGHFNQGGQNNKGPRNYGNNYRGNGHGYQFQNQPPPPQNYFQNQPNPPDQLVIYNANNNPGAASRTQSDHQNGTWNQQQQQPNGPNAYFQNNGTADQLSHGALELSNRAPVQAVETDASTAPVTISNLTTPASCSFFATQIGSGLTKCSHVSSNQ